MSNSEGYVYFILNRDTNSVKIGFTRNKDINKRIKQLQTGCDSVLELLYYVIGNCTNEKYFHRMFSSDRIRNNGEWFTYSYSIKHWILNDKYIRNNNIK